MIARGMMFLVAHAADDVNHPLAERAILASRALALDGTGQNGRITCSDFDYSTASSAIEHGKR